MSVLIFATAIGANSSVSCSNCMVLGGTTADNSQTRVGINTTTPLTDLHIIQQTDAGGDKLRGIRLQRLANTNHWRIMIDPSNNLIFEYNDVGYSYINPTTLAFVQGSDASLKKDVAPVSDLLDKVMQLKAETYHYNINQETDPLIYGFIAQDVKKVFPEFVSQTKEDGRLGISYAGFGVVAIKAIQEQQYLIKGQNDKIAELERKIDLLLAAGDLHQRNKP